MVKGATSPKSPKSPTSPKGVLKKAQSAYFIFMNENRDSIRKEHGLTAVGDVAKKIGEIWGSMDEKAKAPYQKKADADRVRFEKQKAAGWEPAERKSKKNKDEKKKKKEKDPNAPKRPMSAYFLWLNASRAKIVAEHKLEGQVAAVAKKAGEIWGTMTEKEKQPWEQKAESAKKKYLQEVEQYKASKCDEDDDDEEEEEEEEEE